MPPKADPDSFDFETMAVVLYAMLESGTVLGSPHYEMMASVSGSRTKSSFEHQFRKVKARAKELQEQVKSGALPAGAGAAPKGPPRTPGGSGRKRSIPTEREYRK